MARLVKPPPALLTRMSSLPNCAAVASMALGDLVELGDVHLKREGVATECFDFGDEILGGVFVAKAEGDVGACGGECDGDGATESAGCAGDEGGLAGQREIWDLRVGLEWSWSVRFYTDGALGFAWGSLFGVYPPCFLRECARGVF